MSRLRNPKHEVVAQAIAFDMADDLAAYTAAGYAKPRRGNAVRLIRRSEYSQAILARVAELQAPALAMGGMKLARVLQEMENIATFSLGSCLARDKDGKLVINPEGNPIIDWDRLTPQQWAAVTEYDAKKGRIKVNKAMMLIELRRRHEPPAPRIPGDSDDDHAVPADEVARWDEPPALGVRAN
jgi:hypothetical protein